ncbi:MAG: GNAT family N-acetyltransferase [Caulobacteraceae bacterium]|nr:GNAT family N-acetyltransferase [Caulobacter sp.]
MHAAAFPSPWFAAELATLAASPGVATLVVEADGVALGFVMARRVADEAEILTLAIDPAHRRRGVGRTLVEAAAALGGDALFLEVAQDNAPARALYAACGFREAGRRRGYYARTAGPPVDALVLRRDA